MQFILALLKAFFANKTTAIAVAEPKEDQAVKKPTKEPKEEQMITIKLLTEMFPNANHDRLEKYIEPLKKTCDVYNITTPRRIACFLAQIGHESGGFRYTSENLNYSDTALLSVFKKYFKTQMDAAQYARKPELIANRVYASRMGNGNEQSGDGWKHRGRGLIQITGKDNYSALATSLDKTIDETIDYLETPEGATMSAGWYWDSTKLNKLADKGDMKRITRKINGGYNGLKDRIELYNTACDILGIDEA